MSHVACRWVSTPFAFPPIRILPLLNRIPPPIERERAFLSQGKTTRGETGTASDRDLRRRSRYMDRDVAGEISMGVDLRGSFRGGLRGFERHRPTPTEIRARTVARALAA